MIVDELITDVALMVGDPQFAEVTRDQYMMLLRNAAYDARNKGWLVPHEDDESITVDSTTFEYAIPVTFAYFESLWQSETVNGVEVYVNQIPREHYTLRLNGALPKISFQTITQLITGRTLKIVGQKRPTLYAHPQQVIDPGMESFMRERVLYFAFRILGAGQSELARWRQTMSQQSYQSSEEFLRHHPQEFRQWPSSLHIPGR